MLLNSISFACFFGVFWILYRLGALLGIKVQNLLLLIFSCVFYAIADLRMLWLVLAASLVFFVIGQRIRKSKNNSFIWLLTGVFVALGGLLYFKYLNFFCESVSMLLHCMGLSFDAKFVNIAMPLGVSFWTFRLLSYLIEIYRERIDPEVNFFDFTNYVIFFPCILSGPIDRPGDFLPQIKKVRGFDVEAFSHGIYRIVLGLFKKMVIAERLSIYVNSVYGNPDSPGLNLIFAAIFYTIQIYADFSGYSDMAIGISRLLGIKVRENFNLPFFVTNIADYWRRWHMSLTSWLTDYLFMPLNVELRNMGKIGLFISSTTTMVIIGLWHGANWTYVAFGLYHSMLYLPLIIMNKFGKKSKVKTEGFFIPFKSFLKMAKTFILVTIGLIIFRAPNITAACDVFVNILTDTTLSISSLQSAILPFTGDNTCLSAFIVAVFFSSALFLHEYMQFIKKNDLLKRADFIWQVFLIASIMLFSVNANSSFIYFQF